MRSRVLGVFILLAGLVADSFGGSIRRLDPSDGPETGFYGGFEFPLS